MVVLVCFSDGIRGWGLLVVFSLVVETGCRHFSCVDRLGIAGGPWPSAGIM